MIYFWIPALTFVGAFLFFAAGLFAARASRLQAALSGMPAGMPVADAPAGPSLAAHAVDPRPTLGTTQVFDRVLFAEADARSTRMELQEQAARAEELQGQVDEIAEQLLRVQRQTADAVAVADAVDDPGAVAQRSPAAKTTAPAPDLGAKLERERKRTLTLERELSAMQMHLIEGPVADVVTSIRGDLVIAQDQARTRQALAERLADENARQKALLGELGWMRTELARLRSENGDLRARGMVMKTPKRPRTTLRLGDAGRSWRETLQTLVDRLAERDEVRAAVVADERGLVVASSGDNSDQMAAAGAVVTRAALQVSHLLPIGTPRKMVLQDEHDLRVAVRPLDTEGGTLSLITLALGDTQDPKPSDKISDKASDKTSDKISALTDEAIAVQTTP